MFVTQIARTSHWHQMVSIIAVNPVIPVVD